MRKPKGKTKKQPKGPRPVTAWFEVGSDGVIDPDGTAEKFYPADIRCRVVPIRKPTEKELERLSQKLYDGAFARYSMHPCWDDVARLAWKLGAR